MARQPQRKTSTTARRATKTTAKKKTYASRTRAKRSKSGWKLPKLPKFNLQRLFLAVISIGGFTGASWFSGCEKALEAKDNSKQVVQDKSNRDNDNEDRSNKKNDRNVVDDDSPELPAIRSKDRNSVVKHKYYTLLYNEKHEQAEWVAYQLTKRSITGKAERANDFRPDPDVATGSATPDDYRNSGYDRGHLAPAGDFKLSQESMSETFFMSNMSPQLHVFNAGIWEQLESKVREWTKKREKVYVVTGPILQDGLPTIGNKNKVSVPKEYYKVVYDPEAKQMIGFIIANRQSFKQLPALAVKVDEIEKRTGHDFFPALPDDLEDKLESQVVPTDWFFEKKPKKK